MSATEKPARKDSRITIVLPSDVRSQLKAIARDEATPESVLVRRWIVERIKQQRKQ